MENARAQEETPDVIHLGSADQFRRLVAVIADGIVVVDAEGKVRLVNAAAEELLGRSADELVGGHFGFPVATDEATELEIMRPDRSTVVVELRSAEIEWDGEPAAVAALIDITHHARTTEEQASMIERLQELDRLKTEFVSMVSHDLRSPMATIAGFADTLRFNWDAFEDEHKRKILDRISQSTTQLARLVENVLHVSQIESGRLSYDIEDLDVAALVHRVVGENMQPVHGVEATHQIEVSVPDTLPLVRADEMRQWQILTNLVANALKFSAEGTPVSVVVSADDSHVRVDVTDHGYGIAPEDKAKLFTKFTRLRLPEGIKVKGTGLGLYICKAMVEAQGGTIWIESAPGEGSTFSYTIPRA